MAAQAARVYTFPGPDFHVQLSTLDWRMPGVYSRRLLIFRLPNVVDAQGRALEAIRYGLNSVVQRCPPLAGTGVLQPDEDGQQRGRRTMVPGPGLQLIVKDASAILNYEQLARESFPMRELKDELLMPIGTTAIMAGPFPVAKVQATFIDGGLILALAVSHILADGGSTNTLTELLAQEIRKSQQPQADTNDRFPSILGLNKSTISSLQTTNPPPSDDLISQHSAYRLNLDPTSLTDTQRKERLQAFLNAKAPEGAEFRTYNLSEKALVALKAAASPAPPARISTHDAILALLWRTMLLARQASGILLRTSSSNVAEDPLAIPTTVYVPTNARHHFQLDDTYIGNAVYHTQSTLPLSTLLLPASTSLPIMASSIRSAISAVNPARTTSFVALAAAQPHASMVGWSGVDPVTNISGVAFVTFFNQNRQLYGGDWGPALGEIKRFRCPDQGFFPGSNLMCGILPRLSGGGGELIVNERGNVLDVMEKDETWAKHCTRIG